MKNPKPTAVEYLEYLEPYFFNQGTFSDDIMFSSLQDISDTQKIMLKSKKLMDKFV